MKASEATQSGLIKSKRTPKVIAVNTVAMLANFTMEVPRFLLSSR